MAPQVDADALLSHLPASVPVLLIGGGRPRRAAPGLEIDGEGAAAIAVRHLLSLGRTRVAHIAGPADNRDAAARVRGYRAAMAAAALPVRILPGDFREESGHAAVSALLADGPMPDALFAANDQMAIGALVRLREAGLRVPQDVAVAGFDDIPLAALVTPALTTMRVDTVALGRRAIGRLVARIAGEDDDTIETHAPQLVPRASTAIQSPDNGPHSRGSRP